MLDAVRTLATRCTLSDERLEEIACDFGRDQVIGCEIPVGTLLLARREYTNIKNPNDAVVSYALIVALAEELVDSIKDFRWYSAFNPVEDLYGLSEDFWTKSNALSRAVDNLRSHSRG
jgi:hypothetical protein